MGRRGRLKIVTWNARALLHGDREARTAKLQMAGRIHRDDAVLLLQEVHGDLTTLREGLQRVGCDRRCIHSSHARHSEGGVATVLPKHWCDGSLGYRMVATNEEVVLGRVSKVSVSAEPGTLSECPEFIFWNIHNVGLSRQQVLDTTCKIRMDLQMACESPDRQIVFVGGDFNIHDEPRERPHPAAQALRAVPVHAYGLAPQAVRAGSVHADAAPMAAAAASRTPPPAPPLARPGDGCWRSVWRVMTEIVPDDGGTPQPTHWSEATSTGNRIDRLFVSLPQWQVTQTFMAASVLEEAEELSRKGISDHAPLMAAICSSRGGPADESRLRPLPKHLFKEELCQTLAVELWSRAQGDTLQPGRQMELATCCLQEAARRARNAELARGSRSVWAKAMAMRSMGRAVWRNDVRLARALLLKRPWMAEFCSVGEATVAVTNHRRFRDQFNQLQREELDAQRQRLELEANGAQGEMARSRARNQARALDKRAKFWSPWARRRSVRGIMAEDGSLATSPADMAQEIARYWGTIFTHQQPLAPEARRYAERFAGGLPRGFETAAPPMRRHLHRLLAKVRDSALGPDGLPFEAWRVHPIFGDVIFACTLHVATGARMPLSFNEVLAIFAPKGEEQGDLPSSVIRKAADLRPLGLKNTGNKLVAGLFNWQATPLVKRLAAPIQRGFVRGRQFMENLIEIDGEARAISALAVTSGIPSFLVSFDFRQAFPSMLHPWLMLTLEVYQLPQGFCNATVVMYSLVLNLMGVGIALVALYITMCGVLQGCPLSGSPCTRWDPMCSTRTCRPVSTSAPMA